MLSAVADPAGLLWGLGGGGVCGGAEVLEGFWAWVLCSFQPKLHPLSVAMTRSDNHLQDALPTQKLEWVTPKISLMEAGDTEGNKYAVVPNELDFKTNPLGPS